MVCIFFYYVTIKEAYSFLIKKIYDNYGTYSLKDLNELCNGHKSFQCIISPNFNYEYHTLMLYMSTI